MVWSSHYYSADASLPFPLVPQHDVRSDRVAALIAWMLVVRVDDLVKDGAKRRRLRRSMILDKIINANRVLSKRSRPLSGPCHSLVIIREGG
jgi:hypothetical protein